MSRFKTTLDTAKRNLIILDTETGSKLTIQQKLSDRFMHTLLDEEDSDGLVEYANDLSDDLTNSTLALELFGDSVIQFDDKKWPRLSGGVFLRNCNLNNPNLKNVSLTDLNAPSSIEFNISYSTIDKFSWHNDERLIISHCMINAKYNKITERVSPERNEWFMNERVEKEMW